MKPEQIDELIAAVESGDEVRITHPNGLTVRLTSEHLADLRLARGLSALFQEQSARLDDWLRRFAAEFGGEPGYDAQRWAP